MIPRLFFKILFFSLMCLFVGRSKVAVKYTFSSDDEDGAEDDDVESSKSSSSKNK